MSACNGGVIYLDSYLSRFAQVLRDHYQIDKSLRIVTVLQYYIEYKQE